MQVKNDRKSGRRPNMNLIIKISQWMMAHNDAKNPRTAEELAEMATRDLGAAEDLCGAEISHRTIRRIAPSLGIKLRSKPRVLRAPVTGRPKVAKVRALSEEVINLYQAIGADEKTIEAVRARLLMGE